MPEYVGFALVTGSSHLWCAKNRRIENEREGNDEPRDFRQPNLLTSSNATTNRELAFPVPVGWGPVREEAVRGWSARGGIIPLFRATIGTGKKYFKNCMICLK